MNVAITNVVDDKFGDLDDDGGNSGCFDVPINLAPGASVSCQFTEADHGPRRHRRTSNTVTACGTDENGNPVSDSDDATRRHHAEADRPRHRQGGDLADAAERHRQLLADGDEQGPGHGDERPARRPGARGHHLPDGERRRRGACTVSPALITCNLGTIAPGQTVTIAITGQGDDRRLAHQHGDGDGLGGRETNPADNVDSAVDGRAGAAQAADGEAASRTRRRACLALTVTPKMIKADGKPDQVTAKVTAGRQAGQGREGLRQGRGRPEDRHARTARASW